MLELITQGGWSSEEICADLDINGQKFHTLTARLRDEGHNIRPVSDREAEDRRRQTWEVITTPEGLAALAQRRGSTMTSSLRRFRAQQVSSPELTSPRLTRYLRNVEEELAELLAAAAALVPAASEPGGEDLDN